MNKTTLSLALLLAACAPALAQTQVKNAWVRASVPQQMATGAFMTLVSPQGGRLIEAASPVAGVVEIHEMKMQNNVMRMNAIAGLDLPAGRPVELKPGGYHVMLMDLKRTLTPGTEVPITLTIEGKDGKRETVQLKAPVRPLASGGPMQHVQ